MNIKFAVVIHNIDAMSVDDTHSFAKYLSLETWSNSDGLRFGL
jgi:hypothetical protein